MLVTCLTFLQAIVQCPALESLDISAKFQTLSLGGRTLTHQPAVPAGQGVISRLGADTLAAALTQVQYLYHYLIIESRDSDTLLIYFGSSRQT